MAGSKWIQAATERMESKGTKGSFRKIADRMGVSTKEAADKITAHPERYGKKVRKKAQFAENVI